jgi:hypothetical protein
LLDGDAPLKLKLRPTGRSMIDASSSPKNGGQSYRSAT